MRARLRAARSTGGCVVRGDTGGRLCVVDWEHVGPGPRRDSLGVISEKPVARACAVASGSR